MLFFSRHSKKWLILALALQSCSKPPAANDCCISNLINERISQEAKWGQIPCQKELIDSLLQEELTCENAIKIAILNSPKIQAAFENLGIAHADLVAAGLFSNPVFSLELRYPQENGFHTNIEYMITTSLLDVFLRPLRIKEASCEYAKVKLQVADVILNHAFDVRESYYDLLFQREQMVYFESIAEVEEILSQLKERQRGTDTINILDFQFQESAKMQAELELAKQRAKLIELEEAFTRLLGLCQSTQYKLPEELPDEMEILRSDPESLENLALEKRLDVQAQKMEIHRIARSLGLKSWWTYTDLQRGLAGERDPDGKSFMGPGFAGEIPLFNWGQADRERIYAKLRMAQNEFEELCLQVRSEVRQSLEVCKLYESIFQSYKEQLIPLQSNLLESSEKLYNVMGLGIDKLLTTKREQLSIEKEKNESLRAYLVAKVNLDRSLGGNLTLLEGECR